MATIYQLSSPTQHLADIDLPTLGKNDVGVSITGTGHSVCGATIGGAGNCIKVSRAKKITIADFKCPGPGEAGYGLYIEMPTPDAITDALWLRDAEIDIPPGSAAQYGIRGYGLRNPRIDGFIGKHFGTQPRDSFGIRDCFGGLVTNLQLWGRRGFSIGPNSTDKNTTVVKGLVIDGFNINMNGDWRDAGYPMPAVTVNINGQNVVFKSDFLTTLMDVAPSTFQAGTSELVMKNGTFVQCNLKKAHLRAEGAKGVHPAVQGVIIDTVAFYDRVSDGKGGWKLQQVKPRIDGGNPGGIKLVNC